MVVANAEPASTWLGACNASALAAAGTTTIGELVEPPPLAGSRVAVIVRPPACRSVIGTVSVLPEVPLKVTTIGGAPSGSLLLMVTLPEKFGIGWPDALRTVIVTATGAPAVVCVCGLSIVTTVDTPVNASLTTGRLTLRAPPTSARITYEPEVKFAV